MYVRQEGRWCLKATASSPISIPVLSSFFFCQSSSRVGVCTFAFLPSCSNSVTLPFACIKGSVAFPRGFPPRLSHEAFPQGCPSCHHSQSPPDVSILSRETCFPCPASNFKPRIHSHHGGTWDSPVGKLGGKASGESLEGKPHIL